MNDYLKLVRSHRHLRSLPELKAYYLPYHDLGLKLKAKILDFIAQNRALIQKEKIRYSENIDEYVFLNREQVVHEKKMGYLKNFLNLALKGEFHYSAATLRDFWIRARISSLQLAEVNIENHTRLDLLNNLAKVCGYSSFIDFLDSHYTDNDPNLKILILPFPGIQNRAAEVEVILNKRLDLLAEKNNLPLTITFKCMSSNWGNRRYFTPAFARKEGERENADLVIFGDVFAPGNGLTKIALQYVIIGYEPRFIGQPENHVFKTYEYGELLTGTLPNEVDAVIFWCLGIKEFMDQNYEKAIHYFLLIPTATERDKEEVYFRIAVIYDIIEKNALAVQYYSMALEAGGVVNTWQNTNLWTAGGDLLSKNALAEQEILKSKTVKLLLFEIARINHALLMKKNGSKTHALKVLEKAVQYIQESWMESVYKELIAKAYFTLAQLYISQTRQGRIPNPEKVITYHLTAIQLSTEIEIHHAAAVFLKKHGYLERATAYVKENHGNNSELLSHYTIEED